jgi:protein-S-isoprenylcysteine O-methyltransferase Ste14
MPAVALMGFVLFFALAFGLRTWIQYRRTGATGFVGISGAFGSVEWLGGVGFAAAIAAAFAAPLLQMAGVVSPSSLVDERWAHAVGLALFAAGLAGTLWAQLAMGDSWRIGVDAGARTTLIDSGPFRWVRNPIFTAMTLATIGLLLLAPNVVSVIALLALIAALEIHVRRVEEPYLTATHGEHYLRYAAATGRFVPGVGRLRPGAGTATARPATPGR